MKFTDLFIQRPVLATVLSLLILVLGIRSVLVLSVREFPFTENGIITIETPFTGADPEVIESFITTTLEEAIAQSNGIDYLTSVSSQGLSSISAVLQLNYDTDKALTEITTNVSSVLDQLPAESQAPQISIDVGQATDLMYIGFYSDVLNRSEITDYITRIAQPKIRAVNGILDAEILGYRRFALRAWLDTAKLSAYGLTPTDVFNVLGTNDFLAAGGRTDGQMVAVNITMNTNLKSVEEFHDLVIKYTDDAIIKLGDVAKVSLGSENYDSAAGFNGKDAVYIGIQVVPNGNVLQVISDVDDVVEEIKEGLPQGLKAQVVYDVTDFINHSIEEVEIVLLQTIVIVTLVIFLFLGSIRSVVIPVVAIPLSLIGTFFIMYMFGYTINLLTLLALVLAIGLVVDDAIIVVENVDRHIRGGMSPFKAAVTAARELANPIIAISVVLIAVYLPIGFIGGMTGALFTEFAFTLAGAVAISAIIALTLSPMMCSKMMSLDIEQKNRFVNYIEGSFQKLHYHYQNVLEKSLNHTNVTAVFAIIIILGLVFLYATAKTELAPDEDQGLILADLMTEPNANVFQTILYSKEFYKKMATFPEAKYIFQFDGITNVNGSIGTLNTSQSGIVFKSWDDRHRTTSELLPLMQAQADQISGAKIAMYQPSPLPGSDGLPVQFIILTTKSYAELNEVATEFMHAANATGMFSYIDNDLKLDMLQASIQIDRYKAAKLGMQMDDIGNMVSAALSQQYVNFFELDNRSYRVIPQVNRNERLNYDQILNYYITTANGDTVQLSTFATMVTEVVPESLNHFHEVPAATISAVLSPGITMGAALTRLENLAETVLPDGYDIDYAGESRQYEKESATFLITFAFSMIIIFLCLAALFESFCDPLIILISVPMSIFGALLFINLGVGGASLNIYTQVGLVTLIGLISKHGILIVQFAHTLQAEGRSKREAIVTAAGIRLRPILMTTGAMVLGVIPLLLATGAGAESRFNIGLVIASGISIGTLFTLFVVPAMYLLIGKKHAHAQA
jgi:multidrug efflux pump